MKKIHILNKKNIFFVFFSKKNRLKFDFQTRNNKLPKIKSIKLMGKEGHKNGAKTKPPRNGGKLKKWRKTVK
jgi:hypothetical protein